MDTVIDKQLYDAQINNSLKLIAIISMLIDHIGYGFFPENPMFRMMGRIAFPIFAFCIAEGFRHTSSYSKYLLRLLLFSFISQGPYSLVFTDRMNIFVMLASGLLALNLLKEKKYIYLSIIMGIFYLTGVGYGLYGILLILSFYVFREKPLQLYGFILLITGAYMFAHHSWLQVYSLLALPLIRYKDKFPGIEMNKYFFYAFYPIHLFVIALLRD